MITCVSRMPVYTTVRDETRVIGELTPLETILDPQYILIRPECPVSVNNGNCELGIFEGYAESCADLRWLLDSNRREQLRNTIYNNINHGVKAVTVVEHLLRLYLLYKERFDHVLNVFREVYEEILCLTAHLCEKYSVDDSKYMNYVMVEHFLHTQYPADWFELLSPLATLSRANSLYPYKYGGSLLESWITEQHIQAMEYFLKHGHQLPITVKCQADFYHSDKVQNTETINIPVKFVNVPVRMRGFGNITPLTWACLQGTPKVVSLLLQYGAQPLHPFSGSKCPHCNWDQPLFVLCNTINSRMERMCTAKESTSTLGDWEQSDVYRTEQYIECLKWLLQVHPYLPVQFKCEFKNLTSDRRHKEKSFLSYICVDKRVKEYLPNELIENVATLQSICRYNIRCSLSNVIQPLPQALTYLPLPVILKKYLNLQ